MRRQVFAIGDSFADTLDEFSSGVSVLFSLRSVPRLSRGFFRLAAYERYIVLWSLFLLPAVGVAIRTVRMPRLQRLLMAWHLSQCHLDASFALEYGRTVARLVRVVARDGFYAAKCLEKSLVVCFLLRRKGVPAEICLGARVMGERLEAHAWVEYRGTVLDDGDEFIPAFARFEKPLISATKSHTLSPAQEENKR